MHSRAITGCVERGPTNAFVTTPRVSRRLQKDSTVLQEQTQVIKEEAESIKGELRNPVAQVHWFADDMKHSCDEILGEFNNLEAPKPEAADSVGTYESAGGG